MARKSFKPGALTAPLPPALVSLKCGEEINLITIGWTGILSTHPPRTYISVRPERHSYKMLRSSGEFVINLASVDMAKTVDYCGVFTGAKVDKFKECALTPVPSKEVDAPSVAECPISLECRVVEVIPMGTHDVFIADILAVSCDDAILDPDGRIDYERANLLAYAHGEYFALGEKVGKFGFSAKKPTKNAKPAAKAPAEKTAASTSTKKAPAEKTASAKASAASTPTKKAPTEKTAGSKSDRHAPSGAKGDKHGAKKQRATDAAADGHRPFYLDAPRGKKNKGRGKKK